ncbi:MAG: hypothetical protein ACYDAO_09115 [Thermoplasmataceae archaeon]
MTKVEYLKFIDYFTNQYHLQEIFLIISAILVAYGTNDIHKETNFNFAFSSLSTVIIFYGLICGFLFGQRVEKGLYGYILTMPIRRKTFFILSAFLDFFVLPSLIFIILSIISVLQFFAIPYTLLIFDWFATVSILAFIISIGRIFGSITKNGIATFILTYGSITTIDELSRYGIINSSNSAFLSFIDNGFASNFSVLTSLISTSFLVFSMLVIISSSIILLNSNLKNGR